MIVIYMSSRVFLSLIPPKCAKNRNPKRSIVYCGAPCTCNTLPLDNFKTHLHPALPYITRGRTHYQPPRTSPHQSYTLPRCSNPKENFLPQETFQAPQGMNFLRCLLLEYPHVPCHLHNSVYPLPTTGFCWNR